MRKTAPVAHPLKRPDTTSAEPKVEADITCIRHRFPRIESLAMLYKLLTEVRTRVRFGARRGSRFSLPWIAIRHGKTGRTRASRDDAQRSINFIAVKNGAQQDVRLSAGRGDPSAQDCDLRQFLHSPFGAQSWTMVVAGFEDS